MAAWITELEAVLGTSIATLGTLDVTLGAVAAVLLILGMAVTFFRRVRGRG